HVNPLRPLRGALLIEELARDAVGIPHEHVRPAASPTQRAVRHREVVTRQIELGVSRLGEEHLLRIRDRDLASRGGESKGLGHALILSAPSLLAWNAPTAAATKATKIAKITQKARLIGCRG